MDTYSPAPNYTYIKTLGFSNFYYNWDSPLDIIGNDYVLTMMFSRENITFKTDSNGEGTLTYSEALSPVVDAFLGIGTRSNSGDGPCTIYFDDVYVYRHEEQ